MLNIAIDGPAGSGKSSVAKTLAKSLNIVYLDTGAMYRGLAVWAKDSGLDVDDAVAIEPHLSSVEMQIYYGEDDLQHVVVNGTDVTSRIRDNDVSMLASKISAHKAVREKLVALQQQIAAKTSVVLDGRDIGTVVLPDATFKFYLTASVEERATRRCKELLEKGQSACFESIKTEIAQRDYNDMTRANSPLKKADDAFEIDTTDMPLDSVIKLVSDYVSAGMKK